MPHQQHVWDVATEIDPETGGLWYREVVVLFPRQSGKTTLLLPKFVWRAEASHLLGGRQRMLYAAQTKNDAFEKFDEDYIEDLAASRVMRGRYRVSNNQGRKRIRFQSGSLLSPVATTTKSGHGKTLDDGTLDEAWSQTDNRIEAAWRPAMITRPQAQLWLTSTAGTRASTYLRAKVLAGRAIVEANDPQSRTAYFEYAAQPGADPFDPAVWWSCMPALGYTIGEQAIRHELDTIEGGVLEFQRAYLNQWPDDVEDVEWVLPKVSWANCLDSLSERSGSAALAVDVSPDRSTAAVSFAAARADGLPMVRVVRHGQGCTWLPQHVGEIVRTKGAAAVVLDGIGPVSSMRDEIERELGGRCPVHIMTAGEVADSCGSIFDAVVTEQLRHVGQAVLDEAIKGATKRIMPGGRYAWDRRTSSSDITPLVSVTAALFGLSKYGGGELVF